MSDVLNMREAIRRLGRALGVTVAGAVPAGRMADDLLEHVQGVIDRLPKFRNGPWRDVLLTSAAAYTAKDGERISPQGFNPVITLPTTFTRCDSDTDIQNDLSRVHVIGDGYYIWSSTLGAWNKADGLGLNDLFPFGPEDMPGIVALAAISASPEYGDGSVAPAIAQQASQATAGLRSRFYRNPRWARRFTDYVPAADY